VCRPVNISLDVYVAQDMVQHVSQGDFVISRLRLWQMIACLSISDSMQPRNSREVMCERHSSRLWGHFLFRRFLEQAQDFPSTLFFRNQVCRRFGRWLSSDRRTGRYRWQKFLALSEDFFAHPRFSHTHVYRGRLLNNAHALQLI